MRITSQAARSARYSWLLALAGYAAPAVSGQAEAIRMRDSRTQSAIELMGGFAERAGIASDRPQQRYLWTDSFAVCNFLGLSRATGDERYERLALRLVDRVHEVLGRHLGGLSRYAQQGELRRSAATRLAFRELGLAIGLQAAERMSRAVMEGRENSRARPEVRKQLEGLLRYAPLRHEIESFWLEPEHRRTRSWNEHRDINEVMLATSLAPDGCLLLPPLD